MHYDEWKIYQVVIYTAVLFAGAVGFWGIGIIRQQRYRLQAYRGKLQTETEVLERERVRIAADLHDGLSPLVSVTNLQIQLFEKNADYGHLATARRLTTDTLRKIREIAGHLAPYELEHKKLAQACETFLNAMSDLANVKVDWTSDDGGEALSRDRQLHVYRMVQELVNNAVKHSAAERIEASLVSSGNSVILRVSDNGKGFDAGRLQQAGNSGGFGGLGLRNLTSRADLLRARIELDTAPGQGTRFTIRIPV